MKLIEYLRRAGVPARLHAEALASLEEARSRAKGLTLFKWKVRLLHAGKIAKLLPWEADRLIDLRPDLADWDIAPMTNITAHGDNIPWPGGRPAEHAWFDESDPAAVAANYWCEGAHPRSQKSRKAWYRRNAGEYRAWRLGMPVDLATAEVFQGGGVTVFHCSGAWQILTADKWLGFIPVAVRVGFEVSNVWRSSDGAQLWYPIKGHDLRAPVTWSVIPFR
jgi:hypothetical protein